MSDEQFKERKYATTLTDAGIRASTHGRKSNLVTETGRIESVARRLGLTAQTDHSALLTLIRKLRPVDCGKPLIRVGSAGDGGYLVPDDLDGIEYCFSPGVSNVADFEDQLAGRRIRSFLADYSIKSPPKQRPEFVFDQKFIGPRNTIDTMTLDSWKNKYLKEYFSDLILQMDIEGAEYGVLLQISDLLLSQFRIMVVEFHFLDRMFDRWVFPTICETFQRILQYFEVAHIHPNNIGGSVRKHDIEIPKLLEFTFINKKRVHVAGPQLLFPHPLDRDNGNRKRLPLPRCWY